MKLLINLVLSMLSLFGTAQTFTHQDSIRGSITPERSWWDLNDYDLKVKVNPDQKYIQGSNTISYTVVSKHQRMQIDLQEPMKIDSVIRDGKQLLIEHDGNAHYITLEKEQSIGDQNSITVYFSGNPKVAVRAPWDGGFSWSEDSNGNSFVATSCQGLGASVWWPCKDHMYDEAEHMTISVTTPSHLMDVSNGQLINTEENADWSTYTWEVNNPINNYGVNVNIGDYTHFGETYQGEKGPLKVDYFVLKEDLEKAKKQFAQTSMMLEAFEHWFGPYPFYEDGFKLVQVPYLGMEHQSSVTYGNKFENGYLGSDLSGTGWGLKFDFIIIHEAGHEWFANNITYKDAADMWIHEGFTAYSENLYLNYHFSKEAARAYVIGTRKRIQNDIPIIGTYDVNSEGSGDMYYKGANILHMIRTMIGNDDQWRTILRGLNEEFYHQTVTTAQIESYIIKHSGIDLSSFFDQYLRTVQIPELELKQEKKTLYYRFNNVIDQFQMPFDLEIDGKLIRLEGSTKWKQIPTNSKKATVKTVEDYYITLKN
ncbi:MAG: M1 family metallopeptidase [Flavobacteriaceae bacterium]|jgi:aminopeptidase N|nr:M1 family metallopeptidase [Flavobacteriaceae bacterium]NVJ72785.1 M1 family metallopeptidase [Flavobacteriaceae bacterium]